MDIIKVSNEEQVISKLGSIIENLAAESIEKNGKFFVGLSGGSLILHLCACLPLIKTDWSSWVLFFCDERVVPESSDDSTFGTYKKLLLPHVPLKESQFVTIKQNVTAEEAALDYYDRLKSETKTEGDALLRFDLLLLGMGPDGHTCSLFPGHELLKESIKQVASIVDSPKPPPQRITLTLPVINNAKNCIYAVSGNSKSDMLRRVLNDKENLPAALVKPTNGTVTWILDNEAASKL